MVVLGAVMAIGPLSIDMYLPAFPEIARRLETSASQVQLTLTACVAGLALGQLLIGPLSDRFGRRLPLIAALSTYAVASVLCSLAPSVAVLMALRFVQGLAGAGGVVIASAVVRDLYSGAAAARLFSSLMLVMGLAPILAPLAGAQVLERDVVARDLLGPGRALGADRRARRRSDCGETLPPERRSDHGLGRTLQTMRALLRDRWFVGHALAGGLGFGALFAYVAGSSFVLQGIYGVSPQLYSVLFAMNGLGLIAASQVNARLVGRFGPARLLRARAARDRRRLGHAAGRRRWPAGSASAPCSSRCSSSCPACPSCCPTRRRSRSPTTPRSPGPPRRCSARRSS